MIRSGYQTEWETRMLLSRAIVDRESFVSDFERSMVAVGRDVACAFERLGPAVVRVAARFAALDRARRQPPAFAMPATTPARSRTASYGAVTGRIQTLTSRNALRFVIYDHIHDRAVSCYLVEGRQAMMRQMWDRLATVEGWITRDPESGRPLTVRRVSDITPLPEVEPDGYKRARGALPRGPDEPLPEVLTRRLRDAG